MTQAPAAPAQPKVKKPKTYRTGFCSNGQCEGLNPKNHLGHALPTCTCTSAECACSCHKMFDEMHAIKVEMGKAAPDEPRDVVNHSTYRSKPSPYILPDAASLAAERARLRAATQHRHPDDTTVIGRHAFAPTPTGIRAPKQLEYQVLEVLKSWIDPTFEFVPPDVKLVAFKIGEAEGRAPSVGAVHAVFVRWVKIGFAKYQNRPSKFIGFCAEGTQEELDALKKKHAKAPVRKRYTREDQSRS